MTLFTAGCTSLQRGPVALYAGPEQAQSQVATVLAPEEIELMALDGSELSGSLLGGRQSRYTLLPGEHVLTLRYNALFQLNSENHDVVRSRPVALRFIAVAGETYRFDYAQPRQRDIAVRFAKDPVFALVGEQGRSRYESQPIRSAAEASLMDTISKAFSSEDSRLAVKASALPAAPVAAAPVVAAPAAVAAATVAPAAPAQPVRVAPTSSVHYDLLRDIWLRASPEERARFQAWTQTPEARR